MKQVYGVLVWEMKKWFYALRYPMLVWTGLLLLIHLMPLKTCKYIETHAQFTIIILNELFVVAVIYGMLFLPYYMLTEPYKNPEYPKEKLSDVNSKLRLAARFLVTYMQFGLSLLYGFLSVYGMKKFAGKHHGYMFINLNDDYAYSMLIYDFLGLVIYLTLFLRWYYHTQKRECFFAFLVSGVASSIVYYTKETILQHLAGIPGPLAHLIAILSILIIAFFCFLRCCHYEDKI